MIHQGKPHDMLWIISMGKRFRVRAVATDDAEANRYMNTHRDTAVIAVYGPFILIANVYEGLREGDNV